jgi:hypothetical protein
MLPQFYQTNLQKYLSESQLIRLKLLVWLAAKPKANKNRKVSSDTSFTNSAE